MSKILVIGASGTVGSEISQQLKSKGQEVRRATSKKELAKDQVYLNLSNQDGLSSAFQDVEKLFLLSPPGYVNQNELLIPILNEAKKLGVKKIVLMTAMGANANDSAPMRLVELHLEKLGIAYNIIRPNWFMQNFNSYWIHGINTFGKILLPVEKARGSFIDARDIASVAVELLTTEKFSNQAFDLTGPEALNHDEVASILSSTTNKKIVYENITPPQMYEGLLQAGLNKAYVEFMLLILDFFRQGYSERVTDAVEKITGKKPINFKRYAEDHKKAWA